MSVPAGVPVSVCGACGWRGFPARLWCPRCGKASPETEIAGRGTVVEETRVHRAASRSFDGPVHLGTVALDGGGLAIARLEGVEPGDAATLATEGGAPVARPERPA